MRILVTGSAGFIGRAVCRLFKERAWDVFGLDVRAQTDKGVDHIICDLRDERTTMAAVARVKPDVVIHLAARTDLRETKDLAGYDSNTRGVENLILAIEKVGTCYRAIYTSSQLVCRPGYSPAHAEDYSPHTKYGESKVLTERIVRQQAGVASSWCLVRPTTIWGPGMSAHYQQMLRLIKRGLYFHCGHDPLWKSFGYIENTAWQYFMLANAKPKDIDGKTFYVADYDAISLRRFADDLCREMGARKIPTLPLPVVRGLAKVGDGLNWIGIKAVPFNSFRLTNILTEYRFDMRALEAVCGPLPVEYRIGVERTARWFMGVDCHKSVSLETPGER